jgi:hypothetical protein
MKSSDLDLVLSAWPAARPTAGFADRVMVACAAPVVRGTAEARPRRSTTTGKLLAVAALVAAGVLAPLFLQHSSPPQALASIPVVADLGPLQD